VVPPCKLNINLHSGIDYIVLRMLAKNPDERYQSCAEVVQDLRNYASLGRAKASTRRKTAPPMATQAQPGGGRKVALFALIGVLLIAVGVLGYFVFQQSQQHAVPAAAQPAATAAKTIPVPAPPAEKATAAATAPAAAPERVKPRPARETAAPEKPAYAQVRFEFGGSAYPAAIFDGARRLDDLSSAGKSIQVAAGDHRFRVVSEEVFLDREVDRVKLKADQVHSITLPGLGGATIEVPNDAYDGCEISLNGRKLPPPYPAQVQKLAAGEHMVGFRWTSGKYAGKEFASQLSIQENHVYRVRGAPQTDSATVQQVR
jgi:hypothetical protein